MRRFAFNQDWYAIKYGLAALYANDWTRTRRQNADQINGLTPPPEALDAQEGLRTSASSCATETAITACETLQQLQADPLPHPIVAWKRGHIASPPRRAQLTTYLDETILPMSLVLLAGVTLTSEHAQRIGDLRGLIAVLRRRTADPDALLVFVKSLPKRSARVDYNLACYYADRKEVEPARQSLRLSLVATPLSRRTGLAERAARDPTLEPILQNRTAKGVLDDLRV